MATIDFPTGLSVALIGTIREGYVPAYVNDAAAVGAARRRKVFTRTLRTFSFTTRMTDAQAAILRTFIATTTDGGVIEFNWTHPVTSVVYEVRFAGDELPSIEDVTKGVWDATISLEEI